MSGFVNELIDSTDCCKKFDSTEPTPDIIPEVSGILITRFAHCTTLLVVVGPLWLSRNLAGRKTSIHGDARSVVPLASTTFLAFSETCTVKLSKLVICVRSWFKSLITASGVDSNFLDKSFRKLIFRKTPFAQKLDFEKVTRQI